MIYISPSERVKITYGSYEERFLDEVKPKLGILHNNKPTRIEFSRSLIKIGCTDITPEALEYLYTEYRCKYPKEDTFITFQKG